MQNPKGALQELFQERGGRLPTYETRSRGLPPGMWQSRVTVEWEGRQITEVAEGRGRKKDVEKVVAEQMLRRLQEERASPSRRTVRSPAAHTDSLSPTGRVSLASSRNAAISQRLLPSVSPANLGASTSAHVRTSPMARERAPSPSYSPLSPPSPAGVSAVLGSPARSPISVLQECLQKLSLALPTYTELEEASLFLAPFFQCRCVVRNLSKLPVLEAVGQGSSKQRAKENAAQNMLEKFNGCWTDGTFSTLPSLDPAADPPVGTVDTDVDADIDSRLFPYHPQYYTLDEGGQFFCLAWSTACSDLPVAAHGRGDRESEARRLASCNLLANLAALSS